MFCARAGPAVEAGLSERQIGWPERLVVRLNELIPRLVDKALVQKSRVAASCIERSRV